MRKYSSVLVCLLLTLVSVAQNVHVVPTDSIPNIAAFQQLNEGEQIKERLIQNERRQYLENQKQLGSAMPDTLLLNELELIHPSYAENRITLNLFNYKNGELTDTLPKVYRTFTLCVIRPDSTLEINVSYRNHDEEKIELHIKKDNLSSFIESETYVDSIFKTSEKQTTLSTHLKVNLVENDLTIDHSSFHTYDLISGYFTFTSDRYYVHSEYTPSLRKELREKGYNPGSVDERYVSGTANFTCRVFDPDIYHIGMIDEVPESPTVGKEKKRKRRSRVKTKKAEN